MTDDKQPKSLIITPEEDVPPDEELADNMVFRNSPYHPGQRVSVASKRGVDICWCCHRPVLSMDDFIDLPMKEALIRLCKSRECMIAAARELTGPKPVSIIHQ